VVARQDEHSHVDAATRARIAELILEVENEAIEDTARRLVAATRTTATRTTTTATRAPEGGLYARTRHRGQLPDLVFELSDLVEFSRSEAGDVGAVSLSAPIAERRGRE
jgi:hypothetical protein